MNASENVIPRDSEICDYSDRLLGQPTLRPPSCHSPCTTAIGGRVNLSPLEDQQLGGLIMWVRAGLLFTTYAMVAFGVWLHRFEAPPHSGRAAASAALEDEREAWGHLVQTRRAIKILARYFCPPPQQVACRSVSQNLNI